MDLKPEYLLDTLRRDFSLTSLDDIGEFRKEQLLKSVLKKFVDKEQDASLHSVAIQSFIDRNEAMSTSFTVPNHLEGLVSLWKGKLDAFFNSGDYQSNILTLNACLSNGFAGPGASRGTPHVNFLDKMFDSDLTVTSEGLYRHYVGALPKRWFNAELIRSTNHSVKVVAGSALTTVRKDATKNRTIAKEPSLNMFYQLGAKSIINEQLRVVYNLDISKQPEINKILACSGSITGLIATLDLKDASDSWHVELCRQLLPRNTFEVLDLIRSEFYEVDGVVRRMNMMSSMGNGFTFSLMTLMLTTLIDAFLQLRGDRYTPHRDAVFGDDIILESRHADDFSAVLSELGFTVNTTKSFSTGPFRESCGGDYYNGYDVRGVYIKECSNEVQLYSAFNRLLWWSARYGIRIPGCLLYLKGLADFRPVPLDEADHAGFRIPEKHLTARKYDANGATRYKSLQAVSHSRLVGVVKNHKYDKRATEKYIEYLWGLRKSRRVPGVPEPRFLAGDEHNPMGAYIAFLGGYVRDHSISVRSPTEVSYKVTKQVSSSWDFLPSPYFSVETLTEIWDELLSSS